MIDAWFCAFSLLGNMGFQCLVSQLGSPYRFRARFQPLIFAPGFILQGFPISRGLKLAHGFMCLGFIGTSFYPSWANAFFALGFSASGFTVYSHLVPCTFGAWFYGLFAPGYMEFLSLVLWMIGAWLCGF